MRLGSSRALAWLPLMGSLAQATDVVYVTDLAIYTLLAPCAQDAVNYNVMSMTYDSCPEAVTALQSCVCSGNGYFASLSSAISSDVSYSCGSTASSDQVSASVVFSAYCNQDAVATFATPATPVSQYITDIPEMGYLAPCASSQVAYAVMDMTYSLCPPDAINLATCVCQKNQNSLMVSQTINVQVSEACSSHTADIASAQAFFKAYCNLNSGTSSFPSASNPPGDMSYYITDMPQYSSMAKCAKDALSEAVFTNTYDLCPDGPQLLASCACIKDSMSSIVSSYVTSNIEWDCSSNGAAAGVSSALSIFGLYCSAARNEAVVTGITVSVSQTQPFGLGGATATGTGTGTGARATKTTATTGAGSTTGSGGSGSGSGSSGSSGGSSSGDSDSADGGDSTTTKKSNTGVIVGAVVGVVAGLALLGLAAFFVFRHARQNKNRPPAVDFQPLDNLPPTNNYAGGKSELAGTPLSAAGPGAAAGAELAGTAVAADAAYGAAYGLKPPMPPPSPNPSVSKYNTVSPQSPPVPSVSPVSAHQQQQQPGYGYPYPPPQHPQQAELQGQMYSPNSAYPAPSYAELQGQQALRPQQAELYGQPVYGQAVPYAPQAPQAPQPIYQADSTPIESPNRTTPASGMTFHSGPVPLSYAELDGANGDNNNNNYHPHAI